MIIQRKDGSSLQLGWSDCLMFAFVLSAVGYVIQCAKGTDKYGK